MKYITGTLDFSLTDSSVITLGKFDGLHRGHQELINRIRKISKSGLETIVFTFDVPPTKRLGDNDGRTLITNEERKMMLEEMGIDCLIECPFVPEIMNMEPEIFVKEILVDALKIAHVVVGDDFHFGRNRKGNPQMLRELGKRYHFEVEVVDKLHDGNRVISSTYIREEIEVGNIEKANELLGYSYFITGEVVRGRHLGSKSLLPTINQEPSLLKQLPPFGVYTSQTDIDVKRYRSVTNIGMKPTVGSDRVGVETYLFDCDADLYGLNAKVELLNYQRPERKFASIKELKAQLEEDKKVALKGQFGSEN